MNFELLHPADQIVMLMERIYRYGMTTTSGGNLSVMDDNGDLWITPGSIDKGSLTRRDIVCVKPDGTVEGIHKPSIELPFHQTVYRRRPDVKAVLHAHPPALVAFSIVRRVPDIRLIPNARLICGEVGMAAYGLPGSIALGESIADVLADGTNTVMLENHGVVVAGPDLFRAFMAFETLEFCARLEIEATQLGKPRSLPEEQIALMQYKQAGQFDGFIPHRHTSMEREARREMCAFIHRAYDQQLFTSTQGTFSQRLEDGSFLITPYMKDRKYLEPEDLVLVNGMMAEAGKVPSRSALLHRMIYERQPHVGSVLIAHPPHIMAFAVTDEAFDSRTIPESYIQLRHVPKLPFGSSFLEMERVAATFGPATPVAIIENDCVIVTGASLLNAFDRLEVAEFSAKAILATQGLGAIVAISGEQVAEIDQAFGLV